MKNIKGAIFDLDGTIIDSMPMWHSLFEIYCREVNIEPTEELLEFFRRASIPMVAEKLSCEFNLGTAEEIENALYGIVADYYKNHATLRPNVDKFIKALKEAGVRMCVATVTASVHAKNALLHTGLLEYFEDVISATDMGMDKGNPDFFLEALKCINTEIDETAVFEDSLYAVKIAKSIGFYAVAIYEQNVTDKKQMEDTADKYIYDYAELLK